ncbi:phosphatase PAP2 family protein [Rhodanobacter sp. Si-c]|uniref:Phosphatase PAP2 family protein n=1 Tax=Rhodanobacter lycopersici TaxID=3162487 RepID=A0ABV3Q983_9GAMM
MNAPSLPSVFWEPWNVALFQRMHATASSPHLLVAIATALAEWPLVVAASLTGWLLWRQRDRLGLIRLIVACGMALLTEALVGLLAFHPRPFAAGFGPAWVTHAANNSMPSTHVALAMVMAITLGMRKHRRASVAVLGLAAMLAWARIYVGIHWPADMLGAIINAGVSTMIAAGVARLLPIRCIPSFP